MTSRAVVIGAAIFAVVFFALGTTFGALRPWSYLQEAQPPAPAAKQATPFKPRGDFNSEEETRRLAQIEDPAVTRMRGGLISAESRLTEARLANARLRLEAELPKGEATKEALDRFMAAVRDEVTDAEQRMLLRP